MKNFISVLLVCLCTACDVQKADNTAASVSIANIDTNIDVYIASIKQMQEKGMEPSDIVLQLQKTYGDYFWWAIDKNTGEVVYRYSVGTGVTMTYYREFRVEP